MAFNGFYNAVIEAKHIFLKRIVKNELPSDDEVCNVTGDIVCVKSEPMDFDSDPANMESSLLGTNSVENQASHGCFENVCDGNDHFVSDDWNVANNSSRVELYEVVVTGSSVEIVEKSKHSSKHSSIAPEEATITSSNFDHMIPEHTNTISTKGEHSVQTLSKSYLDEQKEERAQLGCFKPKKRLLTAKRCCYLCPKKINRKSKTCCSNCAETVCGEHSTTLVICAPCTDKGCLTNLLGYYLPDSKRQESDISHTSRLPDDVKFFQCSICAKHFARKDSLRKHTLSCKELLEFKVGSTCIGVTGT